MTNTTSVVATDWIAYTSVGVVVAVSAGMLIGYAKKEISLRRALAFIAAIVSLALLVALTWQSALAAIYVATG